MSCVSEPSTCQAKTRRLPVEKLEGERGNRIISWTTESNLARAIDNRIEVYDVNNGQRIHTFELDPAGGDIYSMAWSPDGNWVVVDQLDSPGALAIPVKGGEPIFINKGIVNPFWITKP